jgi:cell wall-associated NlpC family hydrolase
MDSAYIGIPYIPKGRAFDGADCWGVCLLYAKHILSIDLPEFFYTSSAMLRYAAMYAEIEPEQPRWQLVDKAQVGDIHLFRIGGYTTHCGIHIGNNDFLHTLIGRESCIESVDSIQWRDCLRGTYRYVPTA